MANVVKGTISINDKVTYRTIMDVLKDVFKYDRGGRPKAVWFPNKENEKNVVWFPKLSWGNGEPVADEWDNFFFDSENIFLCQRRILMEKNAEICKGNEKHYNSPLDRIKTGKSIKPFSSENCSDNWHYKTRAVFAKTDDKHYKFFGIYKFKGIQTTQYEKITRNDPKKPSIKSKYIEVFERTSEELIISEWI